MEKKYSDVLSNAGLVGDRLWQSENDHKSGGIFYCSF